VNSGSQSNYDDLYLSAVIDVLFFEKFFFLNRYFLNFLRLHKHKLEYTTLEIV